jgi:hypothetical protein
VIYHEGKLHGQGVLGEDPYRNRMSRVTATPLTGKLLMLASQTPADFTLQPMPECTHTDKAPPPLFTLAIFVPAMGAEDQDLSRIK